MAYREVTMVEVKEVLRQWLGGEPKRRVALRLGLSPKTVRRYCELAERHGISVEHARAKQVARAALVPGRVRTAPPLAHAAPPA